MKKIASKIIIILLGISLAGCEGMTNQDAGVLTGGLLGGLLGSRFGGGGGQIAAIGAGTLIGALVGGQIGRSMDAADRARLNGALEGNNCGQPAYWHNAHTGTDYTVVPTQNVTVGGNPYCREYRTIANIAGKKQQMYGTACRQPDGTWQAVS